jgi:hypothetical protein
LYQEKKKCQCRCEQDRQIRRKGRKYRCRAGRQEERKAGKNAEKMQEEEAFR